MMKSFCTAPRFQRTISGLFLGGCFLSGSLTHAQTVTDIDGNVYNTVTINGRAWMAENLATSRYQDGTPIPLVANSTTWFNQISGGARCFFWNDSALIAPDYGTLYNWNVVSNPLNVCPTGWHVPTDAEWSTMTIFLDPTVSPTAGAVGPGTGTDIGTQLKEAGEAHWDVGNAGTNSSGFTARGAGYRKSIGTFEYLTAFTYFWTSTYGEQSKAWMRSVNFNDPTIGRFILDRLYGASIRCIADITTDIPEDTGYDQFQLFPNPATDRVQVSGLLDGRVDLVITDASGKQVAQRTISGIDRSISVAELAPGLYVVTATSRAGEWLGKLWVE